MKRTIIALTATATLALTACGGGDSEPTATKTVTQDATPSAEKASESDPQKSADDAKREAMDDFDPDEGQPVEGEAGVLYYDEGNEAVLTYGSTYTWPSGLSITVDEAGEYKGGTQYKATMKNGTDGPFDVSLPGVSVECDAEELEPFYDEGAPERPAVTLMPGKSKTWTEAWDGKGDCMYWIQPDFDQESVYFVDDSYALEDDGR